MTVAELIEWLSNHDQSLEVVVPCSDHQFRSCYAETGWMDDYNGECDTTDEQATTVVVIV